MRKSPTKSWASASALVLATGAPILAQTITGSVNGTITDQNGAVVPNATVLVQNVATGVETRSVTNGSGDYNVRFLQIGQYTVTVQQPGFAEQKVGPFTLEVDQMAKIDVHLAVTGSTQQVNVSSELQPILDTDNSRVASTFTAATIENLPLNGRNFSSVTQFIPGAVSSDPKNMISTNATERDTNQSGQVSVNGNRNQSNDYTLDGIEINETINNVIGYNPSPDAIGNLTVITSNADAEYGNANGGDILTVLKSGTNQVHGSAFAFLESNTLNANSWANNYAGTPKQPFTQTFFGGTVGGPVIKNKLFFFADYEGIRNHLGGTEAASVIPAEFRLGNFAAVPKQLYHYVDGVQTPYPGNQVPITSPAAQFLFAHPELYPEPNHAASTNDPTGVNNNYQGSFRKVVRTDQGDIKIDYTLGQHDTIMGRYSQSDAGDTNVAPLEITFPTGNSYPFKGVALNWVHTFSPSIVNEARGGFSRVRWDQGVPSDPTGAFGKNGDSLLGINATQPYDGFASLTFNGNGISATDEPTSLGTTGLASSLIDDTYNYSDDLTIELGKQTFKVGVEILRYQQNDFYPGNDGVMGDFNYSGNFTGGGGINSGYSTADFVTDQAYSAGVAGLVGRSGQRQYRDAAFAQDDYKLRPNLTVNLGVRYEYDQPIYEVNNKQANVDLATGVVYLAGAAGASVLGDSNALYHPTYTNFMPRIGFSYQPMERIVFRGGYGITNYLEGTGANLRLNFNPPFQPSFLGTAVTPTPTSGGTPLTLEQGFSSATNNSNASINTYRAWDANIKPAFIQEFTFSNEIQLSNQTSVSMAYLGQLGQHLITARAANQVQQGTTVAPYAALVGQGGSIVETVSNGTMKYNAAQVQVRHRQSSGLEYQVNYTWSHALTNSSGFYGVAGVNGASPYWQDAYNGAADYGNAGFDLRHNLSATAVYELPFGRGKQFGGGMNRYLDEAAGGWKLSGDAIVYSGFPITINSPNPNGGILNNRAERANNYRPLITKNRSINNWFGTDPTATPCAAGVDNGTCAYGATSPGTFGTAENNTERSPGYEQIDLAASKAFAITEAQHLEFRTDFFNAFNIASYSNPDNTVGDTAFGKITDVRGIPRTIQMSLHYTF